MSPQRFQKTKGNNLIRVIVIGAGRIALSHIPHVVAHKNAKIVGVVDPGFSSRQVMKRLLNVPVYKSIEALGDLNFDAALILTPPQTHFQLAGDMLRHAKHVFLEKPLSLDPTESHKIVELAQENNLQFSCGYVYRYHPVFREIREIVRQRTYGKPLSCRISMIGNVINVDSPRTWRTTGKGAGCLYDYGCHAIDLSLFLFGAPKSATCLSKEELFQAGVIDKFSATLAHDGPDALISSIFCNWADSSVRKATLTMEITTDSNTIRTDGQTITISGQSEQCISIKDLDTDVAYYLRGEEFQNQIDAFLCAIISGRYDYTNGIDAAVCDDILLGLYEAKI